MDRKPARERDPFLLIHRNLHHPGQLIFDRIFNGDELVFFDVHLGDGGIEGRCFSATGRTGDEHHPIRLRNGPPKPLQVLFVESQAIKAQG